MFERLDFSVADRLIWALSLASVIALGACRDEGRARCGEPGMVCNDGSVGTDDMGEPDAMPDASDMDTPVKTCKTVAPVSSGTCELTAGGSSTLIVGTILTPTQILQGGEVLVDPQGKIACVDCDCSAQAQGAT